jgi:hypothetical protein
MTYSSVRLDLQTQICNKFVTKREVLDQQSPILRHWQQLVSEYQDIPCSLSIQCNLIRPSLAISQSILIH